MGFNIKNSKLFAFNVCNRTSEGISQTPDLQPLILYNIELRSIKSLLYPKCSDLNHLSIHTIDTGLMDLILENCSNLATLILNNPLSSPSENSLKFELLNGLQCTGFSIESVRNNSLIKQIFPKLNQLAILRTTRFSPMQDYINWNLIPHLFPKVSLLTLNNVPTEEFSNFPIS